VRVALSELKSDEQVVELMHDRLDIGFVHTSRIPVELRHVLLLSEPFMACLPTGHRLARRRRIAPAQLQGEPFFLFSRNVSPDYHERILGICAAAGFQPEVRHEVSHWMSVATLVSQGMGVALVPEAMRRAAVPGVVLRPLESDARSETYCVWRTGPANGLVQGLLEAVQSERALHAQA
jgi:DNA-binding transcriptional LysR family regulator